MRRREFITGLSGVATLPFSARAQDQRRIPTVGVLWHAGSAEEEAPFFAWLIEGFRALGYVEGRNINLTHRFPNEVPDRFRKMAADLVLLNVDVLVVVGNNAAPYARDATTKIPVVFVLVGDPVGLGLVDNFARPSRNITGFSTFGPDVIGKRLQLLKATVPELSRVALLANANAEISRMYVELSRAAAGQLGLKIQTFEVRSPEELEPAFDAMVSAGMQALITNPDGLAFAQRAVIAELALARRLPLAVWSRQVLGAGGLMSYGNEATDQFQRVATYVDRILKGEKPSDLPVEQPTRFKLAVNLKTAKALGLDLPDKLLALADEVIE